MSFFLKLFFIFTLVFHANTVLADDELKNLIEQFHHEIEQSNDPSETKSKLQSVLSQWLDNFNLARVSLDTHRFTQMKYYQDAGKNEYIKNFPVLASFYFMSHSIEVFSGPMGIYMASNMGMGSGVQMVIGTVGAIISVPGLDPLCLLLFAVSPLKPVQKVMTGIRIVAVKVSGTINNRLQLQEAAAKIFESKDRLQEIVKNSESQMRFNYNFENNSFQKQMLLTSSKQQKPYLILSFRSDTDGRTWIDQLEILDKKELEENKTEFEKILRKFNLSARYAIRNSVLKPRQTFYTRAVATHANSTNIQFKDYALMVKPVIRLRTQRQNETLSCKRLFL